MRAADKLSFFLIANQRWLSTQKKFLEGTFAQLHSMLEKYNWAALKLIYRYSTEWALQDLVAQVAKKKFQLQRRKKYHKCG